MCRHHYVYYSVCQHSEFYRVSYCDKAKALGIPQREQRRAAAVNNRQQSHSHSSPSSAYHIDSHPTTQHHNMSTLAPYQAGAALAGPGKHDHHQPLPNAQLIPRSADATQASGADTHLDINSYGDLNIGLPMDSRSSLSMELTHDGKVMELVARFESQTRHPDSDASQAHQRGRSSSSITICADESDNETVRAFTDRVAGRDDITFHEDGFTYSPRKPIPSPWKTTQPRAPVFQTDLRKEERDKRKATQQNSPTQKPLRGTRSSVDIRKSRNDVTATYLTKDAVDTVDSDIAADVSSSPSSRLQRRLSKPVLRSPGTPPTRTSPRHHATIQINISPSRPDRLDVQDHGRASSVVSTQASEYHSAHSPVSLIPSRGLSSKSSHTSLSTKSFFTAKEHIDEDPPSLSLTFADVAKQIEASRSKMTSPISHSRSKTELSARISTVPAPKKLIRPAIPDLSLRIPQSQPRTLDSQSPYSATSSGSGSASPSKSLSRIPRISSTYDASTKSSSLKRCESVKSLRESKSNIQKGLFKDDRKSNEPTDLHGSNSSQQATPREVPVPRTPVMAQVLPRHVRTLDPSGHTPILNQEHSTKTMTCDQVRNKALDRHNEVNPTAHSDYTPRASNIETEEPNLADTVSKMLTESQSSHISTIEDAEAASDHLPINGASRISSTSTVKAISPQGLSRRDPAILYSGKVIISGTDAVGEAIEGVGSISATHNVATESSGQQFENSNGKHTKGHFDLRATAPVFVPKQHIDGLPPAAPSAMIAPNAPVGPWIQPYHQPGMFNTVAVDPYGMPWLMYPVFVKQGPKSPKKGRTFPRTRKQENSTPSPTKSKFNQLVRTSEGVSEPKEAAQSSKSGTDTAFVSQLEEIARNAAARQSQGTGESRHPYSALPPRNNRPIHNGGNGLYHNSFARGGPRSVGIPIDASAPFPNPIPPSGRKPKGYTLEKLAGGCGNIEVERAVEWGGRSCNKCDPDH